MSLTQLNRPHVTHLERPVKAGGATAMDVGNMKAVPHKEQHGGGVYNKNGKTSGKREKSEHESTKTGKQGRKTNLADT